jgi:hypothetical protein
VAARLRPLILAAALAAGSGALAVGAAGPAAAQETPTTSAVGAFGQATTAPATTEAEAGPESTQTVTEGASEERSLLTESRKVLATIAGLVIAALALALLTVRYWRATAPVPVGVEPLPVGATAGATAAATASASGDPVLGTEAALALASGRRSRRSVAGADHATADEDWEPRGTGEQPAIDLDAPKVHRPARSARVAALARSSEP